MGFKARKKPASVKARVVNAINTLLSEIERTAALHKRTAAFQELFDAHERVASSAARLKTELDADPSLGLHCGCGWRVTIPDSMDDVGFHEYSVDCVRHGALARRRDELDREDAEHRARLEAPYIAQFVASVAVNYRGQPDEALREARRLVKSITKGEN